MTKRNKLALLAGVAGLMGVASAHAAAYNNDLIIGFSDGVGSDLIYDLGPVSAITNGASWNLASVVSTFTLSTVNWGVIGNSSQTLQNRVMYTTFNTQPATVNSGIGSTLDAQTKLLYQNFTTAGTGQHASVDPTLSQSWNVETINPTSSTQYRNAYENPNTVGTTNTLWKLQANSTAGVFLGTFSLAANGTLSFTSNSVTPPPNPPPPPQIVNITRAGNTSTVFFTTTNGSFTYTLYYSSAASITSPVTAWSTSATTVTGNGLTNSIQDTTTDTDRFYRVGVH